MTDDDGVSPGDAARLTSAQRGYLENLLGGIEVRASLGWPLGLTVVLDVESPRGRMIVKMPQGDAAAGYLRRELRAHREMIAPLLSSRPHLAGGFPEFVASDEALGVIVTRYVPGVLAVDSPWEDDSAVYRAAGQLLAALHAVTGARSADYLPAMARRTEDWLRRAVGLVAEDQLAAARAALTGLRLGTVELVATHGDFQPRNWVVDPAPRPGDAEAAEGRRAAGAVAPAVALIDFGRADWRPWYTDLVRLEHKNFLMRPVLRDALLAGMGRSVDGPVVRVAERDGWRLEHLMQSVATVVWSRDVGDADFEEHGRRMLARTLAGWEAL